MYSYEVNHTYTIHPQKENYTSDMNFCNLSLENLKNIHY